MEKSALESMMAYSHEVHIKELFHMFDLLKVDHNILVVFDPTDPDIDLSKFPREDWQATAYGKCK